jgi:hypothetical protein
VELVSELVSAPAEPRLRAARLRLPLSPWPLLVAVSLALLLGAGAALGAWWLASARTSRVAYRVDGSLMGVQIRVVSGDVVVIGGARGGVAVRRSDRSTFGHGPVERRTRQGGRLALSSTCPRLVVGSCSASYRVAVPDNVPVSIRADHGTITLEGYRGSASLATGGGAIAVDAFCGHVLRASSLSGDIAAVASCSPERLELRSTHGAVSATVPAGRYRVEAVSGTGDQLVRGLTADPDAPWEIQALSTSGSVRVEGS